MRKILMALGVAALLVTSVYANNIKLNINQWEVDTPVSPVIEAGTTLVPLRIIGENLGATLGWDSFTKTVTITKGKTEIKLVINSKTVQVNNVRKQLLAAPKLIKGTTMVPIRFISENLDSEVYWDSKSRTVFVSNQGPIIIPEEPLLMQAVDKGDYIILDGASISKGESKKLNMDVTGNGQKETFIIERDSPNGTKIMGICGNYGQHFIYDFMGYGSEGKYHEFEGFGGYDYDELSDDFYAQITCYDLDGDGIKEILVSVGNKRDQMQTLIYHPTGANIKEPFKLIDNIPGEANMYINYGDNAIVVPYGDMGFFSEYIYKNGKLHEMDTTGQIR